MASKEQDSIKALVGKPLRLAGVAGAILAWVVIYFAINHNPWFVFTEHAFSDLGGPIAEDAEIFNNGLIVLGGLFILYALTLIWDANNKVETVGGAFALMAGIFLALIGVYPSGTSPHTFVSIWFFVQADVAITVWGIGILLSGWDVFGLVFTCIGIVGPLIAVVATWPSIAVVEAYGITLIDVWVVLMLRVHYVRGKKPRATFIHFRPQ
jgi:hypothetical membrane protein